MKSRYIAKRYWKDQSTPMGKVDALAKNYDDVINLSLGDTAVEIQGLVIRMLGYGHCVVLLREVLSLIYMSLALGCAYVHLRIDFEEIGIGLHPDRHLAQTGRVVTLILSGR